MRLRSRREPGAFDTTPRPKSKRDSIFFGFSLLSSGMTSTSPPTSRTPSSSDFEPPSRLSFFSSRPRSIHSMVPPSPSSTYSSSTSSSDSSFIPIRAAASTLSLNRSTYPPSTSYSNTPFPARSSSPIPAVPAIPMRSSARPAYIRVPPAEPMKLYKNSAVPSTSYSGLYRPVQGPIIPKRGSSVRRSKYVSNYVVEETTAGNVVGSRPGMHRRMYSGSSGGSGNTEFSQEDYEALREEVRKKRESLVERGLGAGTPVGMAF